MIVDAFVTAAARKDASTDLHVPFRKMTRVRHLIPTSYMNQRVLGGDFEPEEMTPMDIFPAPRCTQPRYKGMHSKEPLKSRFPCIFVPSDGTPLPTDQTCRCKSLGVKEGKDMNQDLWRSCFYVGGS